MLHRLCRGRLKCKFLFIVVNFLVITIIWTCYYRNWTITSIAPVTLSSNSKTSNKHLSKIITVIFRQFEDFDNDVADSVQSFVSLFPNIQILIICDTIPYPPFSFSASNITLRNVRIVPMNINLLASTKDLDPLNYIKTRYVLIVPDSVRISSRHVIQQMLVGLSKNSKSVVAVPFASSPRLFCQRLNWSYKEWSLKYDQIEEEAPCDGVNGKHSILMETDLLRQLPTPFGLPFPESLYLQTTAKKIKISLQHDHSFSDGRALFRSQPGKQHLLRLEKQRRTEFYKKVGVKRVTREDASVHWYGCTRDSERCFPPVMGTPSYLLEARWTPPCCLGHLRKTARHTMAALQQAGARCWLEGVSLLGAVRRSDILSWSEHVDIGIYKSDIARVSWLTKASNKGGVVDSDGYQWEKATQGEFYRVLFSKKNRIYVNILPFSPKNGTMTKKTWFLDHQKEFPDHYLHPMSSIEFAGMQMPCPNNVREFLELKFGKGVIEKTRQEGSIMPYP